MKMMNRAIFTSMLAASAFTAGCNDRPTTASPMCEELARTRDAVRRADLLKKCPRNGPVFTPSEKKKW